MLFQHVLKIEIPLDIKEFLYIEYFISSWCNLHILHQIFVGHLKLHASEINSVKVTAKALQIESLFKACTMLSERRQAISEVNNSRHPVNVCSLKNPNHCKDTLKDASQVSRENYKECQSDSSANRCDIGLCEKESNQTLSQEEGSFETKTTYTISGHSGVVLTDKIEKVNNINTTEYNNTNMDTCENDRESRRYSNGVKNKLKNISSSLDVPMETEQGEFYFIQFLLTSQQTGKK